MGANNGWPLLVMLRKGDTPYCALNYYNKDGDIIATLKAEGVVFTQMPQASDMVKRYLLQSPDGLIVSIHACMDGFKQPAGSTMLGMAQQDFFNPEKYVNKVCGLFGSSPTRLKI